jgi:hypothetical protein
MMNKISTIRFLLCLTFLQFGCEDLEVENLNEPETERVLATPEDYTSVMDGATLQFWNATHKDSPYMTLLVAADFGTSSWGNFNMQNVGTVSEPYGEGNHSALDNTVTASNTAYLETPYSNLYSVSTSANDIVIAVKKSDLSEDEKNQSLAYAYFLRGLGFGYLGLLYDQALIFDENTENIPSLTYDDFVPYNDVLAQGIKDLQNSIEAANKATDISINGFNGLTIDKSTLISLCNAYQAKLMIHGCRTSSETENLNWELVLQKTMNADVDFDLSPIGNGGTNWWHAFFRAGNSGWIRLDQKVVNMVNSSSPYPYPVDGYDSDEAVLPTKDNRFGENGKFSFAGTAPFRANRGVYFYSFWSMNEYASYRANLTDPMPSFEYIENKLNMAEALIRTNQSGAAEIINESRVGVGGLEAASDDDSNLLDKLFYERYLETYEGPGNPFFDRRRTDDLGKKQFVDFPVPARNLNAWGAPLYTTGGK